MAYLDIEVKEDSAEKVAAIAGKPSKNYLKASEFNLVVQKVNSIKTENVAESSSLYFTTARVLATALTGISFLIGGAIASDDSLLAAFGKLQKQINDVLAALDLKQQKDKDFLITTNTPISELHNGCTLYVQNAVIITVPSTLPSDFKCCFKTKIGGQITWAITSPFTWYLGTPTIMYEKADALLTRELGTNNIYLTTT